MQVDTQQLKTIVKEAVTEVLREVSTFDPQRGAKAIAGDTADSLISRKQAASMLGLSVQTVAKMISEGTLSPVRLGRRVLVRESDVRSVIEARTPYRTRCPK